MVIFMDSAKQWSQYSEEQRLPMNALKNASSFKMGKFKKMGECSSKNESNNI